MRFFLLVFCLAWLTGIALGIFVVPWLVVVGVAAAVAAMLARVNQIWPIKIAGLILLLLGFVLGANGDDAATTAACIVSSPLTATITAIERVEEKRIIYAAASDAGCKILISADRFPSLAAGDSIQVSGKVQSISDITNQNPGYAQYLTRRHIVAVVSFPTLTITKSAQPRLNVLPQHLAAQVSKIFPEPDASFVTAILFAQQGTLPKSIITQFQRTGVSHILAISGQNISLLAGLLYLIALVLPIGPWTRTLLIAGLLWTYIALIGAPISAVRAAFFWTMALLAFRLQMLVSLTTIIILTTAIMASYNPQVLADIGFQLSAGAVAGIGLALFLFSTRNNFTDGLLVTAGATAATWPIIAHTFGNFSVSSLLANLLVLPAASLIQIIALPTLLISFSSLPAALLGSFIVHLAWLWMDWVTRLLAAIPYSFIQNIALPNWFFAVYYIALVLLCIIILNNQRRSWREVWE